MMTKKVAEHLNELRRLAVPIVEDTAFRQDGTKKYPAAAHDCVAVFLWRVEETERTWEAVAEIVKPILKKYVPAALDAAIRDAAKSRRHILPYYIDNLHMTASAIEIRGHGIGGQLWEMAAGEVRAAIEADNRRREADYEAYRLACEQGVAVEPQGS